MLRDRKCLASLLLGYDIMIDVGKQKDFSQLRAAILHECFCQGRLQGIGGVCCSVFVEAAPDLSLEGAEILEFWIQSRVIWLCAVWRSSIFERLLEPLELQFGSGLATVLKTKDLLKG